jgi:hypothetical protein
MRKKKLPTVPADKEQGPKLPEPVFPPTRPEDVAGMLRYTGRPKTLKEMDEAITAEVKRRHARGRY